MRLRELTLDLFGQFVGKHFDFGAGDRESDFHIIHGPNEAGKTTTMEAYIRLLYGFQHREPYDFLHQRKNLRVSGVFDVGRELLHLARLPRRAPNLVDQNDNPLPEQAIAVHLGGLSEDDYRSLLCLDDHTIEAGGEDIANARGDIGRLLFSAAAGIADLNEVLTDIRTDADAIYRKRASTTRMAELRRELGEIEREIREQDISAGKWRTLRSAVAAATEAERAVRDECERIRRDLAQTSAMKRALPWLEQHARLMAEIEPYADYPAQLDIDPEELIAMARKQARLQTDRERVRQERDEAIEELKGVVIRPERITLGNRLDELDELRSRTQTAALDLPRRHRELEEVMEDMRRSARELGLVQKAEVAQHVPTAAGLGELEAAREVLQRAQGARETAKQEHADQTADLAAATEALELLREDVPEARGVHDILRRFDAETLAPAVARANEALSSARRDAEEALARLAHAETCFSELPVLAIDIDTVRTLADEHEQAKEKLAAIRKDQARFREDVVAKAARLERIMTHGAVVPDDEALATREERDRLWQLHLAELKADSAAVFESAMREVDSIADARLAQASELAEMRQLELDRAEAEARADAAKTRADDLTSHMDTIEERIAEAVAQIDLIDISPAGLVSWLERLRSAQTAQHQAERVAAEQGEVLGKAAKLMQALAPLLDLEDPTFETALTVARRMAEDEREANERLSTAERRVSELERTGRKRSGRLNEAENALKEARNGWDALIEKLFGSAITSDAALDGLAILRQLREQDQRRQQIARQIEGMEADQGEFTAIIGELASRNEVAQDNPLEAFATLRALADQARTDKENADHLKGRIDKSAQQIDEIERQLDEVDQAMGIHARAFPQGAAVGSIDQLREMVMRARSVIDRRKQIAELEAQIASELATADIAAAHALVADTTAAELEARIGGQEHDLEQAEARHLAATEERVNSRRDLAVVTGDADIAMLAQRRDAILAEIEAAALDFLELDLGLSLAEEAILRYRDTHRSTMMEATEQAFRDLTNGGYSALRTQTDGNREVLLAIDAAGAAKQVADMSKGTRFQLYLALRAAAYEQMVSQGVSLPFFCDDVFETFDEDRTRAACHLMERIGRSGQAIYLTHHQHVVDIAREVCEEAPMVHVL